MSRPTGCKFCGSRSIRDVNEVLYFRCKSYWDASRNDWHQSANCELDLLKDRVRRALQTLEAAERFDLRPSKNYMGDSMVRDDKHGEWAEAQVLDTVLAILKEGQQ